MKTSIWGKDETLVNENINLPRKSTKAIVLLFTKRGRTDCEQFIYPNITDVKVTIEGIPNMVYSQGIGKEYFHKEATRFFGSELTKYPYLTVKSFYKDKFALG